jgi:hypothetical protein
MAARLRELLVGVPRVMLLPEDVSRQKPVVVGELDRLASGGFDA